LRHREHEIGRGNSLLELAGKPHPDDLRKDHGIGLAKHGRLRLDATHAPAENGKPVHHGGMGVGADKRIRIGELGGCLFAVELQLGRFAPDRSRQVFKIYLVADARPRRYHAKIVEGLLRPFEEFISFEILPVLLLDIPLESRVGAEEVYHDRVVANEVHGHERIDFFRIAAERPHGIAHGGKIDYGRYAGEVLHQHACRSKRDLPVRRFGFEPLRNGLNVWLGNGAAILVPQQIFEQNLHGKRQAGDALEAVLFRKRQAVICVDLAAHLQGFAALEAIQRGHR
jgi:hypothetical protein